jgi:hypothetical protein
MELPSEIVTEALIWILGNDVNTLLPKANDEVKNA